MISTNTPNGTRAAIHARVSTTDQTCENQLLELHRYAARRRAAGSGMDNGRLRGPGRLGREGPNCTAMRCSAGAGHTAGGRPTPPGSTFLWSGDWTASAVTYAIS